MSAQHNVNVEKNADALLDTIGALHTRNKSLQKGHATLTRRVQELEAQLETEIARRECGIAKPKHPNCRAVLTVLEQGMMSVAVAEAVPVSHADTQLEQDLKDLRQRINGLEDAALYAFASSGKGKGKATELLEDAITRGIGAALKPGGVLHNALKNG